MNGTYQILVYPNGKNLLDANIHVTNKNTEALLNTSNEDRIEVNVKITQCMLISRHQTMVHTIS